MLSCDDRDLASVFSSKAIEFMEVNQMPPGPLNYVIAYEYCCRRNKMIVKEINDRLKNQLSIDHSFAEQLFYNYIVQYDQMAKQLMEPLFGLMNNLINHIARSATADSSILEQLNNNTELLQNNPDQNAISKICTSLINLTTQTKSAHQELSAQLSNAENEINLLQEKLEETKQEAVTDPMTGLLNRNGWQQRLKSLTAAEKDNATLLIFDVDHFKLINDTFGHLVGDKVITRVAQELKNSLRGRDITARFGGDEFVALLLETNNLSAIKVATNFRKRINELRMRHKSSKKDLPQIGISIGIAPCLSQLSWDTIIDQADKALYQAKSDGRNCVRSRPVEDFRL